MRPLAAIYAIAASILVVGLVLQVFLAGLGVFDDPTFFLTHRDTGYTLEALALFVIVLAAVAAGRARPGRDRGADLRAVPAAVGVRRRPRELARRRGAPPGQRVPHPAAGRSCWRARAWAFARATRPAAEAAMPAVQAAPEPEA